MPKTTSQSPASTSAAHGQTANITPPPVATILPPFSNRR